MKRIILADPGMMRHTGHHRELNITKARGFVAIGYQVDIYANRGFQLSPIDKNLESIRIIPHFSSDPYRDIVNTKMNFGLDEYLMPLAKNFADELVAIDEQAPLLLPTVFPYQICGAVLTGWQHPVRAIAHANPNRYFNHPPAHWDHAFVMTRLLSKPFEIYAFETALQKSFAQNLTTKMRIRPAPFPLEAVSTNLVARRPKLVGLLGGLRPGQGLSHMPMLINTLLASGFQILLQDPDKRLIIDPHRSIGTVGFVENFRALVQTCSALVLNYDPVLYAAMGSGVAWEALVTGTPVMYSRNIASAELFKSYNCGVAFDYGVQSQIANAASDLHNKYDEHLKRAKIAARTARSKYNVQHFVDCLAKSGFLS